MSTELATIINAPLTVQEVVNRRALVVGAMKNAMVEGVHYGTVPGCGDKPCLLQPGSQTLAHLFQLRPKYVVKQVNFEGEHREYEVTCELIHQGSGNPIGEGLGICSTRETKYRFRNVAKEVTWLKEPVPNSYWGLLRKAKENDHGKEALRRWLGTVFEGHDLANIGTKKNAQGEYEFVEFHGGEGKAENANIADCFNTVLKMAKKRAFVDAVITATASNDLFTQDLEDIAENLASADIVVEEKLQSSAGKDKVEEAKPANVKSDTTLPKAEPKGWQTVKCHIGSDGGKIKGRELGSMAVTSLEFIRDNLAKKPNLTAQDTILQKAVAEALGGAGAEKEPEKAKIQPTASKDMLRAKLEAMTIPLDTIVKVNAELGSSAKSFDEIVEDEAKFMLDNWANVEEKIFAK